MSFERSRLIASPVSSSSGARTVQSSSLLPAQAPAPKRFTMRPSRVSRESRKPVASRISTSCAKVSSVTPGRMEKLTQNMAQVRGCREA